MNTKTLFQRDEPLCNFWLAVCKQDNFEKVLAYAMAELFDESMTSEELAGAKKLKQKLMSIADLPDEVGSLAMVSSGLEHDPVGAYKAAKEKAAKEQTKPT